METLTLGLLLALSPMEQKVVEHINANKPGMNQSYVKKLARVISSHSDVVSPFLLSALFMQESGYDYTVCRRHKRKCVDYGIGQIYWRTAKSHKMSVPKLTRDLVYSVRSAVIVLSWFRKVYSKREKYWWVRFNCGTKRSINRKTCNEYKRKVLRWKP